MKRGGTATATSLLTGKVEEVKEACQNGGQGEWQ